MPENRVYLIAHGNGDDFAVDGICEDRDAARKLCAVYNDSVGKKGLCYAERRVITVNRFRTELTDIADMETVYRVTVQFSASGKDKRKFGKWKVLSGISEGICYFDGKKRKPVITEGERCWTADLFVPDGASEAEIIDAARAAVEEQLAAHDAEQT